MAKELNKAAVIADSDVIELLYVLFGQLSDAELADLEERYPGISNYFQSKAAE